MKLKGKRAAWGWSFRVDEDGNLSDPFVQEPKRERRYKTKWRVRPRGLRKLITAQTLIR